VRKKHKNRKKDMELINETAIFLGYKKEEWEAIIQYIKGEN